MKKKVVLLLIYFAFIFSSFAQTNQNSTIQLNWKGVEKWILGSASIPVVSFDGAQYPGENRLPYFVRRMDYDPKFTTLVEVKNPVYAPLTEEENNVLNNKSLFSADLQINTSVLKERNNRYFEIRISPFITKDGKIFKLTSFELALIKSPNPQKVSAASIHTYASSSVLAQGKFVKIHITTSGVYKLTYDDLTNMGVNPANVRIFGYGGALLDQNFMSPKIDDLPECSIWIEKGSDGVFNAGDYILFYAQGVNSWSYDKSKSMFTHNVNYYSNNGYYFVTSDAGIGKKIEDKTLDIPVNATIHPVEEFTDYQLHEKDIINLAKGGKEFYGEPFSDVTSYDFPFTFPNIVTSRPVIAHIDFAATASDQSTFTLTLNGGQPKTVSLPKVAGDNYEQATGASGIFNFTASGDALNFSTSYTKPNSTAQGYLNYIEIIARRQLKMNGSSMQFQNVDYLGMSTYNQYLLSSAGTNVKIWDITDPQNISSMATMNVDGKLSFTASGNDLSTYIAIDPTAAASFPKPTIDGSVPNQNLHALSPVNMVIITHPDFLSQAETLAKAHREQDNLTVEVITTDQIYNEFSSGTPDATAYRWVMKMLYDRAQNTNNTADMPKYLLLFGRGSYDNRELSSSSGDHFILTYQTENSLNITLSYVTDDYFALLDDNEGSDVSSGLMDIGVGRFPVRTVQEATDVVNKTIGFMKNQDKGFWKNQLCFIADDDDSGMHLKQADSVAVSIVRANPSYELTKIYMDAYQQVLNASGQSYPSAKMQLMNLFQSGMFLFNFTGHGSPTGLTNESIFTEADAKTLTNKHLPLFLIASCDFAQFDEDVVSGGEKVLLNPNGGGIGILSAARPVYASQNFTLNKLVGDRLFKKQNGIESRLGDVIAQAKNNTGTEINKLSYMFMGDPAVRLNYPTRYHVITSKVNESTVFGNDTLKALSVANIQGIIADDNGTKIDNFNGTLHVTVYDKAQWITTRGNDGGGTTTYLDRQNILFSGNVEVKKGEYTVLFMLPKDIKYNYGGGRINYYAEDDVNDFEAQGYFENFTVGGTSTNTIADTTGPTVDLYLNSNKFKSGDKVNETPLLIANISDVNGINTVGSGIGHDIMLTVDDDPTQSYVINDYYQAAINSYTEGTLRYKMPEMTNGTHTLSLRAWDLLNNSSTVATSFEVVKGLTPQIFSIYNFPNPVKAQTTIVVNHDRPETILSTTVEIFDLAGRKIWNFKQSSADSIMWDVTGSDGIRVRPGIYLYRVSIQTKDSDITSKTNKMLISE